MTERHPCLPAGRRLDW